ncbi:hypothetical protein XH80_03955 [Bradyrhizobium sp. CCBAU 45384]|nr:hypothetical protein [Bradyrhizobium sp. CCBAU 45384]
MSRDIGLVYIGLSGGARQLIDLLAIAFARIRNHRIVIHHHSFAYINDKKRLAAIVIKLAGPAATHVVLCACMGQKLESLYPEASKRICLSNLALMEDADQVPQQQRGGRSGPLRTVGYLGNITVEKGFLTFIDVVERAQRSCPALRAIVGGPFVDKESRDAFELATKRGVSVEHRGAVYGPAKEDFLAAIDLLLFPTRYVNEAEPIVILEALARGIPVVASDRGCISEMLPSAAGLVLGEDGWASVDKWLMHLSTDDSKMNDLRLGTCRAAATMIDGAAVQREQWLHDLAACPEPLPRTGMI